MAFRAVAASAVELATQTAPEAPSPSLPIESQWGRLMVSRILRAVVEGQTGDEPFGGSDIAAEANQRYADRLPRPVDARAASDVPRRMRAEGRIHLVRVGKAFYEALYRKGARPAE